MKKEEEKEEKGVYKPKLYNREISVGVSRGGSSLRGV